MPLQEDYLDSLLQSMAESAGQREKKAEVPVQPAAAEAAKSAEEAPVRPAVSEIAEPAGEEFFEPEGVESFATEEEETFGRDVAEFLGESAEPVAAEEPEYFEEETAEPVETELPEYFEEESVEPFAMEPLETESVGEEFFEPVEEEFFEPEGVESLEAEEEEIVGRDVAEFLGESAEPVAVEEPEYFEEESAEPVAVEEPEYFEEESVEPFAVEPLETESVGFEPVEEEFFEPEGVESLEAEEEEIFGRDVAEFLGESAEPVAVEEPEYFEEETAEPVAVEEPEYFEEETAESVAVEEPEYFEEETAEPVAVEEPEYFEEETAEPVAVEEPEYFEEESVEPLAVEPLETEAFGEEFFEPVAEEFFEPEGVESLEAEEEESVSSFEEADLQDLEAPDLDAVAGMSEDEIGRLLSAGGQEDEFASASDMDISDEDVLKMLAESDDAELQDIQDLLQKADNNEAVDDSVAAILGDYPEEDLEAKILGGEEEPVAAEDKKLSAKEKRERAKEEKARKKQAAAAAKAAKKAAKEATKAAKQGTALPDTTQIQEAGEDLFDTSVLDSIVSQAGQTAPQTTAPQEDESVDFDLFGNAENAESGFGGEDVATDNAVDSAADTGGMDDFGFDNLFGDVGVDSALFQDVPGGGGSGLPDFLVDETDAELAGIEERDKRAPKQKQGFFAKIMSFLTEEDEEGNENIKLSKENKEILDDMDKEAKDKKGKKGKKGKDKDAKEKPKKEKKPPKPPKPKKEKPPKPVSTVPEKKLSFKKMLPVLLVGLSVGVLLFVFVGSVTDYTDKNAARKAFYEGDYQTCYQNLFGKELNESDRILFGRSESILYIRLWIREYEMFMAEGDRVRALDSLIQTIDRYPGLYAYAGQWKAESDVAVGYAIILDYLSTEFRLTEEQAKTIAAVRSDRDYTKMVTAIAGGKSFEDWDAQAVPQAPAEDTEASGREEKLPDALPGEDGLGGGNFVNN